MINILLITANSITIELVNNNSYYTNEYEMYLNDTFIGKDNKNVISLYDLKPNTNYILKINNEEIKFKTLNKKLKIFKKDYESNDDTLYIQNEIDNLKDDEVLVLDDKYKIVSLFLKDNISVYLTKNCYLIGETDRLKYPILKEDEYLNEKPLGTWEGRSDDSFASIINILGKENIIIYGEGIIDCNAHNSDFWINHREKRIARRPKGIFIHTSNNITLEGIKVCNTPSWNQHAFYCTNINYYNMKLENPMDSPTTDGCDPESCKNVNIIGNYFSVGDDCIAIKSSKIELASIYKTPSENIIIRNNYMSHGHGGVTLGSELSGGIKNVCVTNCIFNNTDRGLRIKTQRGRGNLAIIENVLFDNIYMDNVKSPFVINAFYKAGNDTYDYRFEQKYIEFSEKTPILNEFKFSNIICKNTSYGLGFFLGLPESKIKKITLKNIKVSYNKDTEPGIMAMCHENLKFKNIGIYAKNVKKLEIDNINYIDEPSEKYIVEDILIKEE